MPHLYPVANNWEAVDAIFPAATKPDQRLIINL